MIYFFFAPVHKDEDADAASSNDIRPIGVTVPHALQPHKRLEDGFHDAMTIFDDPSKKNEKAMYRKDEVQSILVFLGNFGNYENMSNVCPGCKGLWGWKRGSIGRNSCL